jgi:sugar phosphate isomerase/epimerase
MLPLGMFSWFGIDLPLESRLNLIKKAGFSTTCLWYGEEEDMVRNNQADLMPRLVQERGLKIDNIHVPYKNANYIWSEANNKREIIWRELTEEIIFCSKHNIPIIVMHPAKGQTPPPPNKYGLQFFRELVKTAENRNITIALENLPAGNECLEYLFSQIPSPNLGFCYDSSHDNIAATFKWQALQKWGERLATAHISDNLGKKDDHFIPGQGNIDWTAVMSRIPKGYIGALLLELDNPKALKGIKPGEFLISAYVQIKKLEEMLGKEEEMDEVDEIMEHEEDF